MYQALTRSDEWTSEVEDLVTMSINFTFKILILPQLKSVINNYLSKFPKNLDPICKKRVPVPGFGCIQNLVQSIYIEGLTYSGDNSAGCEVFE